MNSKTSMILALAAALAIVPLADASTGARPGTPTSGGAPAPEVFLPNAVITEGFDTLTGTGSNQCASGWTCTNNSVPLGTTGWFQGNDTVFPAQAGAPTAYIGANFNNTTGATGTIDNWLISPQFNFGIGATLSFWSRAPAPPAFADRLEIRLSTAGASTSTASFTVVLGTINPTLSSAAGPCVTTASGTGGYPDAWCQYTLTAAQGIPSTGSGRIAFRYFVTNGGPDGANSNYIGIDTFSFDEGVVGTPGLSLAKRVQTSSNAANCASAGTTLSVPAGTQVYYCYQATNTGTLALQTHNLTDTAFGTPILTNLQFALAAGASSPWVVSPALTITQQTSSAATWSACAQATNCTGAPPTTSATATVAAGVVTGFAQQAIDTLGTGAKILFMLVLLGIGLAAVRRLH